MYQQIRSAETITQNVSIARYGVIAAVFWSLFIAYSILWDHQQHKEEGLLLGKMQSQAFFEKDVLYRRWASRHGGVYVPVTESTPPNPYLSHIPERDITTPSGRQLTLMNPAYMTRQVFEIAQEYKGTGRGHITSLKPFRPENAPDSWEKETLLAFERGESESGQLVQIDGKPYYRYMKSLIADKPCLKCHQSQGYQEGDVRGGLSVSVAMEPFYAMMAKEMRGVYINHGIIWFLGLGVIGFGAFRLDRNTKKLHEKSVELEHEIEERKMAQEHLEEQASLLEEEIGERQMAQEKLQEQAAMLEEEITQRIQAGEEKVKLESQLYQAQKMESVGRLAGGVAHDFNNLLTIILGYTQMSLMDVDHSDPLHEKLEEIRKAAERSADLTQQLLAFARKQTISPRIINLNEAVSGMFKMLQRLIGEDICLVWQPGEELWPVRMDSSQLDQILANLCVNARDSISGVGRITVGTGNCLIDGGYCDQHADVEPGEYVRLEITDTGCGMDKKTLGQIFEPFFTTKELGKGTGLGLATVYGIVKQNNGFINIYSEPELGTTFKIFIPRHVNEDMPLSPEIAADETPCGYETVLLVEDELVILDMVAMMLINQGYSVLRAGTPSEAIRLAKEQSGDICLLVTDVIMPEMNGKELYDELKSLNPKLKCLFMSGYTADVIANRGMLDDEVHFIQKPFSLPGLAVKLREVLDGKK